MPSIPLPDVLFWLYLPEMDQVHFVSNFGLPPLGSASHFVGLAVPVFYGKGDVVALGVYLPESLYSPEKRDRILEEAQRTAQKITQIVAEKTKKAISMI